MPLLPEHIGGLPSSHLCRSLCLKRGKSSRRITTIQDDQTPQVSRFICESRGKRIGPYTRNAWIITRGAANGEEVVGVPPHKSSMADKVEEQILWCLYGLPHHCSPLLKEVTNGPIDLVWTLIRIEEVQEILLGKPKLLWIQQVSSNATGDIGECFGAREVRVIWPLTRTEQDCECGLRRRGMLIHSRVLSW